MYQQGKFQIRQALFPLEVAHDFLCRSHKGIVLRQTGFIAPVVFGSNIRNITVCIISDGHTAYKEQLGIIIDQRRKGIRRCAVVGNFVGSKVPIGIPHYSLKGSIPQRIQDFHRNAQFLHKLFVGVIGITGTRPNHVSGLQSCTLYRSSANREHQHKSKH